jgi:hypothetical protein
MSRILNITIFLDAATCSSGNRNAGFGGKCYVQLLSRRLNSKPWEGRQQFSQKCWYLSTRQHGTTYRKTVTFIATAVTTSKLASTDGFEQRNFPWSVTCASCGATLYEVHVTIPPTPSQWPGCYAPHASCLLNSLLPVASKSGNRSRCFPSAFIGTS